MGELQTVRDGIYRECLRAVRDELCELLREEGRLNGELASVRQRIRWLEKQKNENGNAEKDRRS